MGIELAGRIMYQMGVIKHGISVNYSEDIAMNSRLYSSALTRRLRTEYAKSPH